VRTEETPYSGFSPFAPCHFPPYHPRLTQSRVLPRFHLRRTLPLFPSVNPLLQLGPQATAGASFSNAHPVILATAPPSGTGFPSLSSLDHPAPISVRRQLTGFPPPTHCFLCPPPRHHSASQTPLASFRSLLTSSVSCHSPPPGTPICPRCGCKDTIGGPVSSR